MKWFIIIILVIISFVIKRKYFDKLDREHEEYLKKDGYAVFIRSQWPNLIEQIVSISGLSVRKERDDAVILGDANATQIHLGQDMGRLSVVYIRQEQVIQQWKFEQLTSTQDVIKEIYHYIKR